MSRTRGGMRTTPASLRKDEYMVHVHVIEAKDMVNEDGETALDPYVAVRILNQHLCTQTFHAAPRCVFDRLLSFRVQPSTDFEAQSMTLSLELFDVRGFQGVRQNLVGSFTVSVGWLAAQEKHHLHRRWFGLSPPGLDTVRAKVRVSIDIAHRTLSQATFTGEEESDDELICGSFVQRTEHVLCVRVHRALGLSKPGVFTSAHPCIMAHHGGKSVSTSAGEAGSACRWEQQLELPLVKPCTYETVHVQLRYGEGQEPVGAVAIPFDSFLITDANQGSEEPRQAPSAAKAVWHNLYGAPDSAGGSTARRMNQGRTEGFAFRGRVLLTIWAEPCARPSARAFQLHTSQESRIPRRLMSGAQLPVEPGPEQIPYVLSVWLFAGSFLPRTPLSVEAEFGEAAVNFGVFVSPTSDHQFRQGRQLQLTLPSRAEQLPCVSIFLSTSLVRSAGRLARVAHIKYSAETLLLQEASQRPWTQPTWARLEPLPGTSTDASWPAHLLLGLRLEPLRDAQPVPIKDHLGSFYGPPESHELVLRLYLARNLPAADDTGSLDPYFELHCGGARLRTDGKTQTSSPVWNKQYVLPVTVPRGQPHLAPLGLLQLWDRDGGLARDYCGRFEFSLGALPTSLEDEEVREVRLHRAKPGDLKATVLCSITLVPVSARAAPTPAKALSLSGRPCIVEIHPIGCRDLIPGLSGGALTTPFATFDLGLGGNFKSLPRSRSSRYPTPSSPSLVQPAPILLRVSIHADLRHAPSLSVRVLNPGAGGQGVVEIGQGAVRLADKLPGAVDGDTLGKWLAEMRDLHQLTHTVPAAAKAPMRWTLTEETTVHEIRVQAVHQDPSLSRKEYHIVLGDSLFIRDVSFDAMPLVHVAPTMTVAELARSIAIRELRDLRPSEKPMHLRPARTDQILDLYHRGREAALVSDEREADRDDEGLDSPSDSGSPGSASAAGRVAPALGAPNNAVANYGSASSLVSLGGSSGLMDSDDGKDDVEAEDFAPQYMVGRQRLPGPLETADVLGPSTLIDEVYLRRGGLPGESGKAGAVTTRPCGVFKALVRVVPEEDYAQGGRAAAERVARELTSLAQPRNVAVRVYVLRILDILPRDAGGTSDPYVVLSLGGRIVGAREDHVRTQNGCAEVHRCFEIPAMLPGDSTLHLDVRDYELMGGDSLIGSTQLDLERRWFSPAWHRNRLKPLELRPLDSGRDDGSRARVELWLELVPQGLEPYIPLVDLTPAAPAVFEVRAVVWESRRVPMADPAGEGSNLRVTATICGLGSLRTHTQESDVHFGLRDGRGRFNWRFVFRVTTPVRSPRLTIQLWDWSQARSSTLLAQRDLALRRVLTRVRAPRWREPCGASRPNPFPAAGVPPSRDAHRKHARGGVCAHGQSCRAHERVDHPERDAGGPAPGSSCTPRRA